MLSKRHTGHRGTKLAGWLIGSSVHDGISGLNPAYPPDFQPIIGCFGFVCEFVLVLAILCIGIVLVCAKSIKFYSIKCHLKITESLKMIEVGKLLSGESGIYRDAIHVAVCPVVASVVLQPGERVGLTGGRSGAGYHMVTNQSPAPIGIVDPFLDGPVEEGQTFYLFLFPNTVTSLRHAWTHPAFMMTMR